MRTLIMMGLGLAAMTWVSQSASEAQPEVSKATDWLGHVVTTRDGKEIGTVRDIAIDERTGKIRYLVVSVGSFLIENNLIAVAREALVRSSTEDGLLLLYADPNVLAKAKRFASDSHWPATADVVLAADAPAIPGAGNAAEPAAAESRPPGTATIESRSKTAHLSASERVITETAVPVAPSPAPEASQKPTTSASPRLPPITPFDTIDKDGDGVLNRSEFAHEMSPKDSYSKVDANANGVIERAEFDAFAPAS